MKIIYFSKCQTSSTAEVHSVCKIDNLVQLHRTLSVRYKIMLLRHSSRQSPALFINKRNCQLSKQNPKNYQLSSSNFQLPNSQHYLATESFSISCPVRSCRYQIQLADTQFLLGARESCKQRDYRFDGFNLEFQITNRLCTFLLKCYEFS